ncbi:MAG: hypothetical protein ACOCXT_01480 [Candidatus Dojkabacteria bacterium]
MNQKKRRKQNKTLYLTVVGLAIAAVGLIAGSLLVLFMNADEDQYKNVLGTDYVEPDFLECPDGWGAVAYADGFLRRDKEPKSETYDFELDYDSNIMIIGHVKEGHPEDGCDDGPDDDSNPSCDQDQGHEEFEAIIEGVSIGEYEDEGEGIDSWFTIDPWETGFTVGAGDNEVKFEHKGEGEGAQSVDYKLTICAQHVETSPTPTDIRPTDSIPPTSTTSPAPTEVVTTPEDTVTPTETATTPETTPTPSSIAQISPTSPPQGSPDNDTNPAGVIITKEPVNVSGGQGQNLPETKSQLKEFAYISLAIGVIGSIGVMISSRHRKTA